jgi:hypothetical protein
MCMWIIILLRAELLGGVTSVIAPSMFVSGPSAGCDLPVFALQRLPSDTAPVDDPPCRLWLSSTRRICFGYGLKTTQLAESEFVENNPRLDAYALGRVGALHSSGRIQVWACSGLKGRRSAADRFTPPLLRPQGTGFLELLEQPTPTLDHGRNRPCFAFRTFHKPPCTLSRASDDE